MLPCFLWWVLAQICLDGQLGEPLDLFAFLCGISTFQHMCIDGQLGELLDLFASCVCCCICFVCGFFSFVLEKLHVFRIPVVAPWVPTFMQEMIVTNELLNCVL